MKDSKIPRTVLALPGRWVSCTTTSITMPAVERRRCIWAPSPHTALRRIRLELRMLVAKQPSPDGDAEVWAWLEGGYLQGLAGLSTCKPYEATFTISGFRWVYKIEPAEVEGELHPRLTELPAGPTSAAWEG